MKWSYFLTEKKSKIKTLCWAKAGMGMLLLHGAGLLPMFSRHCVILYIFLEIE